MNPNQATTSGAVSKQGLLREGCERSACGRRGSKRRGEGLPVSRLRCTRGGSGAGRYAAERNRKERAKGGGKGAIGCKWQGEAEEGGLGGGNAASNFATPTQLQLSRKRPRNAACQHLWRPAYSERPPPPRREYGRGGWCLIHAAAQEGEQICGGAYVTRSLTHKAKPAAHCSKSVRYRIPGKSWCDGEGGN